MTVSKLMSIHPITVKPSDSIWDALHLLEKHQVHQLPVIEADAVVGVVSRADVDRLLGPLDGRQPEDEMPDVRNRLRVSGFMSAPVQTTTPDAALSDACRVLASEHLPALPVLENGVLVGMISVTDILVAAAEVL